MCKVGGGRIRAELKLLRAGQRCSTQHLPPGTQLDTALGEEPDADCVTWTATLVLQLVAKQPRRASVLYPLGKGSQGTVECVHVEGCERSEARKVRAGGCWWGRGGVLD